MDAELGAKNQVEQPGCLRPGPLLSEHHLSIVRETQGRGRTEEAAARDPRVQGCGMPAGGAAGGLPALPPEVPQRGPALGVSGVLPQKDIGPTRKLVLK